MAENKQNIELEGGTYEIIRERLLKQAGDLRSRLAQLNDARKMVFGSVETQLIANDRISTANHCIARDIIAVGDKCIFGYNVHVGLRSGIKLADVFSVYSFEGKGFKEVDHSIFQDEKFITDFQNLYRYYKEAYFARFLQLGSYVYMVFHLNKETTDFKAFKWLIKDEALNYVDARSDHEVVFPEQHEFKWVRAHRDAQRKGKHPHVSIMDRLFVEAVGGDLTIKIEDNTDDGLGIYREEVDYKDQSLDDAEYLYANLGNLIVLKVKPYQEEFRYFVFNEKMQEVQRIDTLEDSGVLLPDQHGLVFANGYYLQTGEFKVFDPDMRNKRFIRRIASPNGEDFLYVFYNNLKGVYVLLHYNIIEQSVRTPIICNGYTCFDGGELCYFKAEEDPTKHHVIQIWQTPFSRIEQVSKDHADNYLFKVGNKDIVKAMAECQEVLTLSGKKDSYSGLYGDLAKKTVDVLDAYYWINKKEAFELHLPLKNIGETANSAIDEYEKKLRIQKSTSGQISDVVTKAEGLFDTCKNQTFDAVDEFVTVLAELRVLRGEIISLKDLRYTDLSLTEELESKTIENTDTISADCVSFLLQKDALLPYVKRIEEQKALLEKVKTAKEGKDLEETVLQTGKDLELLIEIVSNLKIEDATETTKIIENISGLFASLNQTKASIKKKQKELMGVEAVAEFNAQLKLLDQGIINYLDIADTTAKCDDFLTKLMVQLEELEGKFVEFDDFILKITEKREEIYTVFESRKNSLLEARNNRTASLESAANRILNGIQNRVKSIKEVNEINGFFAADLMIDKVRDIIQNLTDLEDSNKANTIQTRLKTLKEEAIRQLRDRNDLFVDGQNVLQFGRHKFSVNVQPLDLTVVQEREKMQFHLTGTNFFEDIESEEFLKTKDVWTQTIVSENNTVYRSEYLAYQLYRDELDAIPVKSKKLIEFIQTKAATRYQEGYSKGIHDEDAASLLKALVEVSSKIDLLSFDASVRACAAIFWKRFLEGEKRKHYNNQLKSAGEILKVFPKTKEFDFLLTDLETEISEFVETSGLFAYVNVQKAAEYLFKELSRSDEFIISQKSIELKDHFEAYLKENNARKHYDLSVLDLKDNAVEQFLFIQKWLKSYTRQENQPVRFLDETAAFLFLGKDDKAKLIDAKTELTIDNLYGEHPVFENGYNVDYIDFMEKMETFTQETIPQYTHFVELKKQLTADFKQQLRLEEFKPRVLTSFVRNKLIDKVYLPIFGDNLAKQIGTAGENTRTDRMGMLLLISPPGYGKTTLMEYIANRLGLIFMKINGPALGHQVTNLDPADADNQAARQELEKLNLALEMGNNVMLYLDDIQHCHPEFLQKFISLCDAQRKIEGVYKGKSKTYDLRGKRICVVMAGNPYTESGDKFQVPDMLANRADIYNLGDILGDSGDVFKLSYIENSLTSNPVLEKLAGKSLKDVYAILQYVETGSREGLEFEASHTQEEINEYADVLKKMLVIRDVVLTVNQEYIRSAAMADAYRTEPAFKLQGSYRNMNKLAEKILPIMNDQELETLILSHYEGESQTLTNGAEANFLKLKELIGKQSSEDKERWESIKKTFNKNKFFNGGEDDPMSKVLAQMMQFTEGIDGIRDALEKAVKK